MKKLLLALLAVTMVSCGAPNHKTLLVDELVSFNDNEDYPTLDLKLSDVATVECIPLGGVSDSVFVRGFTNKARELVITTDHLYMLDGETAIVTFDRNGKYLNRVSRSGRGPEEYGFIASFGVNEAAHELIVFDGTSKQIVVYDLQGKFKRKFPVGLFYHTISMLDDTTLICYNKYQHRATDPLVSLFSLSDGAKISDITLKYEREYVHDPDGVLEYSTISNAVDGVNLINLRSDTIFFMDKNRDIHARFVDETPYGDDNQMIYPTIETEKYVFFHKLYSPIWTPDAKPKFYAYDKEQKQFFRIAESPEWRYAMVNGFINPTCRTLTQSPNIAAQLISPVRLMDDMDKLPAELKAVAGKVDENDNPVLVLVTFK